MKEFATSLFLCWTTGIIFFTIIYLRLYHVCVLYKKSPQRTCPIQEGEFQFDALLKHLESYSASKFVAIGEDATLVISRVDYDIEAK